MPMPRSAEPLHRTTVNIPLSLVSFFAGLRYSEVEGRIKTGLTRKIVDLLYKDRQRIEALSRRLGRPPEELSVEELDSLEPTEEM